MRANPQTSKWPVISQLLVDHPCRAPCMPNERRQAGSPDRNGLRRIPHVGCGAGPGQTPRHITRDAQRPSPAANERQVGQQPFKVVGEENAWRPCASPFCGAAGCVGQVRRHSRQNQCSRLPVRLAILQRPIWHHQQPVGSDAHAGRVVGWFGGVAGRGLCCARARIRYRRLVAHARPLLRRVRPQAEPQSGARAAVTRDPMCRRFPWKATSP